MKKILLMLVVLTTVLVMGVTSCASTGGAKGDSPAVAAAKGIQSIIGEVKKEVDTVLGPLEKTESGESGLAILNLATGLVKSGPATQKSVSAAVSGLKGALDALLMIKPILKPQVSELLDVANSLVSAIGSVEGLNAAIEKAKEGDIKFLLDKIQETVDNFDSLAGEIVEAAEAL